MSKCGECRLSSRSEGNSSSGSSGAKSGKSAKFFPKKICLFCSQEPIINETVRNKDFFPSKGWFEKFKKQLHKIKLDGQVALTDFLIAARFPEAGISTR